MRILVTRPLEDSEGLAAELERRGHEVLVQPLLTIVPRLDKAPELEGVQALLFSSANGARIFAALSPRRDIPVFAVGEATAQAARDAGFRSVASAAGDVKALAALVTGRLDPNKGALFHGAASVVAGDLKGSLEAAGFRVVREQLYEARSAESLDPAVEYALQTGGVDLALFFSPRTADSFVTLVQGLGADFGATAALCLSQAVAERLKPLGWAELAVAERPTQESLLAALDSLAGRPIAEERASEMGAERSDAESDRQAAIDLPDGESAAEAVIARFGGIRPMASKLGVAVSTVQGWKERKSIPAGRAEQIARAASDNGVALDRALLEAATQSTAAPRSRTSRSAPAAEASAAADPPAEVSERAESKPAASPIPAGSGARNAAPRAARGGGGAFAGGLLGGALIVALAVAAGWFTREAWLPGQPVVSGAADQARIAELETRLGTVSQRLDAQVANAATRLAALESAAPSGPDPQLTARLEALERRLAALEGSAGTASAELAALSSDLAALRQSLEERLSALEQSQSSLAEGAQSSRAELGGEIGFALAVLQLRDAVRAAGSYKAELDALAPYVENLPGAAAAMATLAPEAVNGVPSRSALIAEFPQYARAIVAAAAGEDEEVGWLGAVKRGLADLVSIRPSGPVEGDGPVARVTRAERALAEGELEVAYDEIVPLTGPPAIAAAPWLARVGVRLAAEAALAKLGELALGHGAAGD